MLVVAYHDLPMSVWDVAADGLGRPRSQAADSRNGAPTPVQHISWTPAPCHVLAAGGGSARMWDPDRQVEHHITDGRPSCISCSPCRKHITLDYSDGRLSFLMTSDFSTICTMRYSDSLATLAISPDSSLIPTLGESGCDILSFRVTAYNVDDDVRLPAHPSTVTSPSPIELLAVAPSSDIYCTIHHRGLLNVVDSSGNRLVTYVPPSTQPIRLAVWSEKGEHLAFTDYNRLFVQSIPRHSHSADWSPHFRLRLAEPPTQLVFNKHNHVLVASAHFLHT